VISGAVMQLTSADLDLLTYLLIYVLLGSRCSILCRPILRSY